MQYGCAVKEVDDGRFDSWRSITRQHDRRNNHVAAVIEDDRDRALPWRRRSGERVSTMATVHAADPDCQARGERRNLAADQIEVAHAIEVLVICHTRGAGAEAELGTAIDVCFAAAGCGLALERLT